MSTASAPAGAIEVFFSYSHPDKELRDQLDDHLSVLKRLDVIKAWHDRMITAGTLLEEEILRHLEASRIILLLISSNFIASDFCYSKEMMRAIERHKAGEARVIPIILRPIDNWQATPFGNLLALPTDGRPVTSWQNTDEAFADVARGIRNAVEELTRNQPPVGQTPVPTLPPIWNVPHNRNPNFTGRDTLLAELRTALTSGQTAALTQAISGLGGVGKTQLAVEYAYRFAGEYSLVWWVPSEEPATLASVYADLAGALDLPEQGATEQMVMVEAVRLWLGRNGGWLLVFDNAPGPTEVSGYLPQGGGGHVLVTSRNPNWGSVASPLTVQVFEREHSVEFLLKRTGQSDGEAAKELADVLGDLPLALEQAGAYMEETGTSLSQYQALFQDRQRELLRRGASSQDYPDTVATTWEISFQRLPSEAAVLLNLCAFLAPDDIPRNLLTEGAEHLPDPLAATVMDPLAWGEAVAALRRYSLAEVGGETLSLHRLVQAVARDRAGRGEQEVVG